MSSGNVHIFKIDEQIMRGMTRQQLAQGHTLAVAGSVREAAASWGQ